MSYLLWEDRRDVSLGYMYLKDAAFKELAI